MEELRFSGTSREPASAFGASIRTPGITLMDTLPAGVTNVKCTDCTTCKFTGPAVLSCPIKDLAPGDETDWILRVTPTRASTIQNNVRVTSTVRDLNQQNDTATERTTVTAVAGSADLKVSQVDSPDPVSAGTQVTYSVTVTNAGPSTAVGVVLTDIVPAGLSRSSLRCSECNLCSINGTTLRCPLGDLASGASKVWNLHGVPTVASTLRNTVSVTSSVRDSNQTNNTSSETTTVTQATSAR